MEQKGTLKYRKLQRTPQSGENAGKKKWYATAVTDREVDFEGFVSHISDHVSPYSRGTIHGVLMDVILPIVVSSSMNYAKKWFNFYLFIFKA